jgi:GNAT superfamily N-acetyltransferase
MIDYLKWDSDFFNLKIGRIEVSNKLKFNKLDFSKSDIMSYDLVYLFSYDGPINSESFLPNRLDLVDIMLTMSKPFEADELEQSIEFRTELTNSELIECYEIARQTSVVSRFYKEPLIGKEKTIELYHKWIDNSINQKFSDGIFVYKHEGRIIGIHIIKTDVQKGNGIFTLTGVHNDFQGMGIGKRLWKNSYLFWQSNYNLTQIISPFSLNNTGSFNFHLKMGFNKIESIKYIYHLRTDKQ